MSTSAVTRAHLAASDDPTILGEIIRRECDSIATLIKSASVAHACIVERSSRSPDTGQFVLPAWVSSLLMRTRAALLARCDNACACMGLATEGTDNYALRQALNFIPTLYLAMDLQHAIAITCGMRIVPKEAR
jgi:hypothetical protein